MKNKRRLFKVFIIVLIFSAFIRLANIFFFVLGDYPKKNVYALSYTGYCVWGIMDDVGEYKELGWERQVVIDFDGEYDISRGSRGIWDILGLFGIHNVKEEDGSVSFYIPDYSCNISIEDERISFDCTRNNENDYAYFKVEDDQIILVDDRYKQAMEKHAEKVDEIITKADETLKNYKVVMEEFTITATIFESVLLVVHAFLIALLTVSCRRMVEKMTNEDQNSNLAKRHSLKWGLVEMLVYSFMIELAICVIKSNGSSIDFIFICIVFGVPVYIITMLISFAIYFIRRKKLKNEVVQICIED